MSSAGCNDYNPISCIRYVLTTLASVTAINHPCILHVPLNGSGRNHMCISIFLLIDFPDIESTLDKTTLKIREVAHTGFVLW